MPNHGFIGFHSGEPIPPDGTASIYVRPQVKSFTGKRLHVAEACAQFFLIDLRVGKDSLFIANEPVLAEAFTRTHAGKLIEKLRKGVYSVVAPPMVPAYCGGKRAGVAPIDASLIPPSAVTADLADEIEKMGERVTCPRCYCTMDLSLMVRNGGSEPRPFTAVLFGEWE